MHLPHLWTMRVPNNFTNLPQPIHVYHRAHRKYIPQCPETVLNNPLTFLLQYNRLHAPVQLYLSMLVFSIFYQ